jgi:hypothetical protein
VGSATPVASPPFKPSTKRRAGGRKGLS